MLIHLDEYRKAKAAAATAATAAAAAAAAVPACEEELLCVNWNPAFGVIALSCFQRPQEISPLLPEEADAVKPAFISRVTALASQI